MKCKNCGIELEEKQKYCAKYGERIEETSLRDDDSVGNVKNRTGKKKWFIGLGLMLLVVLCLGGLGWDNIKKLIVNDSINGRWELVSGTGDLVEFFNELNIENNKMELNYELSEVSLHFKSDLIEIDNRYHVDLNTFIVETITDFMNPDLPFLFRFEDKTKDEYVKKFKEAIEEEVLDSRSFSEEEIEEVKKEITPLIEFYLQFFQYEGEKYMVVADNGKKHDLKKMESEVKKKLRLPSDILNYSDVVFELVDIGLSDFNLIFAILEDNFLHAINPSNKEIWYQKVE